VVTAADKRPAVDFSESATLLHVQWVCIRIIAIRPNTVWTTSCCNTVYHLYRADAVTSKQNDRYIIYNNTICVEYNSAAVFIGPKPADALRHPATRLHGRKSFHCPFRSHHPHRDRRTRLIQPALPPFRIHVISKQQRTGRVVLVVKVSFSLHNRPREYNNYRNKNKTSPNLLPHPFRFVNTLRLHCTRRTANNYSSTTPLDDPILPPIRSNFGPLNYENKLQRPLSYA